MNEQHPKRILIIGLTERMGGVETFIYNTTVFSDRKKYEYDYLIHGADHCVFQHQINDFYNNANHIHFVRKIKSNPFTWFKDMVAFYKDNGEKYDYIHLQTGATSEVIYAFPFCLFYGIKVIAHSHNGNGYSPIVNAIFGPIVNWVSTKKLACSKVAAEWLFGKKVNNVIVINNGVDTDRFIYNVEKRDKIRELYNIRDELVIGHIGRFSEQKNHEKILDIFKEILLKKPTAKLIFVGGGEKEQFIRNRVKEEKLDANVIFAGKQMETEAYYSAFDVFLMPSLYEGLPIVGIEAQTSGLPCFFSDKIDKQILITDNAKMIPLLAESSEWAEEIVDKAEKHIDRRNDAKVIDENGYSIRSTVKSLESVYEV